MRGLSLPKLYQQKLAQLQLEKQRELVELALWKQRELDDLALWHKRELEEIDRHAQQKIERLLAAYAEEYGIHAEMQKKISDLLMMYFGNNMAMVGSLMQYIAALPGLLAQAQSAAMSSMNWGSLVESNKGGKMSEVNAGMAEGGTIIARKPTVAVFGERGTEAATFTPIGRTGTDVNKVFGDVGGFGSGVGGNIKLNVSLSPDLEARIVDNSMKQVAVVIEHVRRER